MNRDRGKLLRIILKSLAALVIIFIVVYLFTSGGAVYKWVKLKLFPGSFTNATLEDAARKDNKEELYLEFNKDNWLYYPRLGIEAPVQWDIPQSEANGLLASGLVHIVDSATPDENGDIIISGHSSYYWWVKGDYKTAFVSLPEAQTGDTIILRKDKIYLYEVSGTREIRGDDPLDFAVKGTEKGNLYLTTCVPIGTDLRRLIVIAEFKKEI